MRPLDWLVLAASLVFIVVYGVARGRGVRTLDGYLLAGRTLGWRTIGLSIMATQASAITFISTPGQGFADGMRFVQFYLGLPLAMVVISALAVPIYHRLKVYTAYEYLEGRFDLKTRSLAASLFLVQRGLAAGLTIYAPALVLSVLLGWSIHWTNILTGGLVILYTAIGGARAVNQTQTQQMLIMLGGLAVAIVLVLLALPPDVSLLDAVTVAGKMGRLNAIDFSFDLENRYTLWSGLIGGFFVALSYFGTDQSQVGRYLTGRSVAESRLGLLFNGMVKVPMQFFILFLGAMVFVFYVFVAPPLFFNPVEVRRVEQGPHAAAFRALEDEHRAAFEVRQARARDLVRARHAGDPEGLAAAAGALDAAQRGMTEVRERAVALLRENDSEAETSDTNYVFLSFVLGFFPAGAVGLLLAVVFAASMSSTSAELSALASTTTVDVGRRLFGRVWRPEREVMLSRLVTVFWGAFAIGFAEFASRLGSLIEAVNILGSLVYGTILGIFLVAFLLPRVGGSAVFLAALAAETAVIACFLLSEISFLWYNVVGCVLVMALGLALAPLLPRRVAREA